MEIKDIRHGWLNVARRLQSAARKTSGYAILDIRVLVDGTGNPVEQNGNPILWSSPVIFKLEPGKFDLIKFLDCFLITPIDLDAEIS